MSDQHLTDEDLARRTRELLAAAERISFQLVVQNEKLAAVIDRVQLEIVSPLKKELGDDSDR